MAKYDQSIGTPQAEGRDMVSAEANTGNPLRGDFERMARRRFQDPKPRRRGDWWIIQVRQDVVVNGKPIVRDGRSLTLDQTLVLSKAREYGAKVAAKRAIVSWCRGSAAFIATFQHDRSIPSIWSARKRSS